MFFKSEEEAVFLKKEKGVFKNDNGQEIEWTKITFANPSTFENHELAYNPIIDRDLEGLQKGQKVQLNLELEPTNKKSRVIVTNVIAV